MTGAFAFKILNKFKTEGFGLHRPKKEMSSNWKFVRHVPLAAACLFALDAQAGEALPDQPRPLVAERCLNAMGMQNVQPINEMAREMSPEIMLDRIFSSVAPDFQKALLSRPKDPDKPVKGAEDMRDPNYFLPAIATMEMPFNWIRVMADGRVIEPAPAGAAKSDSNWKRVTGGAPGGQQKKPLPPFLFFLPTPQRY
jgi:hypothetical protein